MIKYVIGDLISMFKEQKFNVILQGCNAHHTMGSGIAAQIKREFPGAYEADKQTPYGDKNKLGTYSQFHDIMIGATILNCYTQYNYGHTKVHADYDAIRNVMIEVKDEFPGYKIGMPMIGAGLAGGDWTIISKIIEEELDSEDVTVVLYEGEYGRIKHLAEYLNCNNGDILEDLKTIEKFNLVDRNILNNIIQELQ